MGDSLGMVVVTLTKIVMNLSMIRNQTVQKNHIGSAVSEILRYTQTNKQTSCYFYIKILAATPLPYRGSVVYETEEVGK